MAKEEKAHSAQTAGGNLIATAAQTLPKLSQSQVPRQEWDRMRARQDWETKSRTSTLQVSGRLPGCA